MQLSRCFLRARVGLLIATGAAVLALSGCGGEGGFTRPLTEPQGSVNVTVGSQTLTLSNVHEAYDSASQTTLIMANDGTTGKLDSMGQHQMQISFPGHAPGTWTSGQGCTFSMNMGAGMQNFSGIKVTCTQYPGVGGNIMGTFNGSMDSDAVSGVFTVERTQ